MVLTAEERLSRAKVELLICLRKYNDYSAKVGLETKKLTNKGSYWHDLWNQAFAAENKKWLEFCEKNQALHTKKAEETFAEHERKLKILERNINNAERVVDILEENLPAPIATVTATVPLEDPQ